MVKPPYSTDYLGTRNTDLCILGFLYPVLTLAHVVLLLHLQAAL